MVEIFDCNSFCLYVDEPTLIGRSESKKKKVKKSSANLTFQLADGPRPSGGCLFFPG